MIIALGSLVLVVFFMLWIRPTTASIEALDRQIALLELQQEKKGILMPLYHELMKQRPPDIPRELATGDRKPLPREEIAGLIPLFRDLATQAGLTTTSVTPRLESLESTPGRLSVDVVVQGNIFALRDYFFNLAEFPSFGGIEFLSVRQVGAGADEKQVELKLWLHTT